MVDFQPSSDMDDLFDFGAPRSAPDTAPPTASAPSAVHDLFGSLISGTQVISTPVPQQFGSRREQRESQGVRREAVPAAPVRSPRLSKRDEKAMARAARNRKQLSRDSGDRRAVARASRSVEYAAPAARRLRRSEIALMHSKAPKAPRKHPLSVLVTMAAVGGMFAVAGLPAYAVSTAHATAAKSDAVTTQSLTVNSTATTAATTRDGYRATTPDQLAEMSKDALRAANNAEYLASGARALGDDYPWPYELASFQGGGLSPLNYYYRECVDFVAWRINRDQGYYSAPYKWVWSTLTPTGGDASQWKYAWQVHGWPISDVPIVGSVAWFASDHVAYVKSVLAGGMVLVEEYNYVPGVYSQRTIPASSVDAFLYPPT